MKHIFFLGLFISYSLIAFGVLSGSCDYKPPPVLVPIKPYVVIDKNGGATDYTIVCVDANGMRFTFDTNFMNEDKYQVGDTIK